MTKEKIIAFLEGRLSTTEKQAVDTKIATDPNFAKKVATVKSDWEAKIVLGRAFVKSKMKDWEKPTKADETTAFSSKKNWENALAAESSFLESLTSSSKPNQEEAIPSAKVVPLWRKYTLSLSIAASVLFLLTVGTRQWSTANLSNDALLSAHYTADIDLSRSKGSANEAALVTMENALEQANYTAAIKEGERLLSTTTDESTIVKINYALAQTYQKQGDYPNAIRYFEIVENTDLGSVKKTAQINSILLLFLNGEKNKALSKLRTIQTTEADNLGVADKKRLMELEQKLTHPLRFWVN